MRRHASPEQQRDLMDGHVALASELGLPLVIHNREADAETLDALAPFDGTVILHCFSSPDLAPAAVERGYYVSFAGNVTYPNAADLRAAAARIPLDRLLAETDSPYLSPQPLRGTKNEPANVVHTLRALAEGRTTISAADAFELQVQRITLPMPASTASLSGSVW